MVTKDVASNAIGLTKALFFCTVIDSFLYLINDGESILTLYDISR